jgi:response regulator RpfG family c-di-GMP phosphodiesterase
LTQERAPLLLIVDDEPRILSALRRCLRREPYEILAAEGPAEALRIAAEQPVDVVLSDYKMPGTTGLALLSQIRELRPDATLLLITGWTESIPEEDFAIAGIRQVVNKPWDDAELKELLRATVKELRTRESVEGSSPGLSGGDLE